MSRPDYFPNCMALSSKMEPCLGYSETRTKLDLEEKENERLRAAMKRAHEALDQMIIWMPSGFAPQSQENAMRLAYEARKEIRDMLDPGQAQKSPA